MDFTIKTRLQRVKELTLKIESYDRMYILFDGQKVSAGCYGLAILDAFARPTSWEDALLLLKSQIKHQRDWVEINVTIRKLIDKGISFYPPLTQWVSFLNPLACLCRLPVRKINKPFFIQICKERDYVINDLFGRCIKLTA